DVAANGRPWEVGLDAAQDHEVASVDGHREELGRRPREIARHAVDELDGRAGGLEVEVLLRVHRRELRRAEAPREPPGRLRRGARGVVPSLEAGHHYRAAKCRPVVPYQRAHRREPTVPMRGRYPRVPRSWLKSTG